MIFQIIIVVAIFCIGLSINGAYIKRTEQAHVEATRLAILRAYEDGVISLNEARNAAFGFNNVSGGDIQVTEYNGKSVPLRELYGYIEASKKPPYVQEVEKKSNRANPFATTSSGVWTYDAEAKDATTETLV